MRHRLVDMDYREPTCFTGPYGRYHRAVYEFKHPDYPRSSDPWVRKLCAMIEQRESYGSDRERYALDWPLYARLFDTFEDVRVGSTKEMIEALLLCTRESVDEQGNTYTEPLDYSELTDVFGQDERFNEFFLGLYQELFYNIRKLQENDIFAMKYVLLPIMTSSGSKLAVGAIWKIVAHAGGIEALRRRGFSTDPIAPEDLDYLFHMLSIRNCTTMLSYISNGASMIENSPGVAQLITALTTLESERAPHRRNDGFRRRASSKPSMASSLLLDFVKLIKEPVAYAEDALLGEGTFRPTDTDSVETIDVPSEYRGG